MGVQELRLRTNRLVTSLPLVRPLPPSPITWPGLLFYPEEESSAFLRNVGTYPPNYFASQPKYSILHKQYFIGESISAI
jgi:hypothetical protein